MLLKSVFEYTEEWVSKHTNAIGTVRTVLKLKGINLRIRNVLIRTKGLEGSVNQTSKSSKLAWPGQKKKAV